MPPKKRRSRKPRSIRDIVGIGKKYADLLKKQGIKSTWDLLTRAATAQDRRKLTSETGIETADLQKWSKQAELLMIDGIGLEYVTLLEQAGIDSTPELALCDPGNLHEALVKINNKKHLVKRIPSEQEITRWIRQALRSRHTASK